MATPLRSWNSVAANNAAIDNINQHSQGPPQQSTSSITRTRVVKGAPATSRPNVPASAHRPSITSSSASNTSDFSNDDEDSFRDRRQSARLAASGGGNFAHQNEPRGRQGAPPSRAQTQAFYGTRSTQQQNNASASPRPAQTPAANRENQSPATPKSKSYPSGKGNPSTSNYQQLRAAQTSELMVFENASASSNSSAKPKAAQSAKPMNSGPAAKSAKSDSEFPCPYEDCTMGFKSLGYLKSHKSDAHFYCKKCDVDCEDDEDLMYHKVSSDRHICCHECGEDFRSEGGRDRHLLQSHGPQQEVNCIGCKMIFPSGAGLISHIYNEQCKGRGGTLVNRLNRSILQENRAKASLYLDALAHENSDSRAFRIDDDSVTDLSSVGGGVGVQSSLLDSENPNPSLTAARLNLMDQEGDLASITSIVRGSGSTISAGSDAQTARDDWPKMESEPISRDKNPAGQMIEGLEGLKLDSKNGKAPSTVGWTQAFFPDAKPTPATPGWLASTANPIGGRTAPTYADPRSTSGAKAWDHMKFEQELDGKYKCPFAKCGSSYIELQGLKDHLTGGYHTGTADRCVKCRKIFKSPAALVAHMESRSTRCNVRDTNRFGHLLHAVTGGFLGVSGRFEDGTPVIQEVEEPRPADPDFGVIDPEDDDYPW